MFSGFPQIRPRSVQTGSWSIERLTRASSCARAGLSLAWAFSLTCLVWALKSKGQKAPKSPCWVLRARRMECFIEAPLARSAEQFSPLPAAALPSWLFINQGIRKGLSRALNMWAEEMEWTHMQMSIDSLPFIKLKCCWERNRSSTMWVSEIVALDCLYLPAVCLSACLSFHCREQSGVM